MRLLRGEATRITAATILSQGISCIWILRFLTGTHSTLRIRLRNLRPQKKFILPCLALGLAPFIMQFTESALSISFNTSLLNYGGDTAVGAMTILSSVMQFSMLPLQGLTQGAQPIISFNYGAKNIDRVKKAFHLLLRSAVCYSTLLWLLCMPSSRPLRLEHGNIGSQLIDWPLEHVVKCLVFYHPDDPAALRAEQDALLLEVCGISKSLIPELHFWQD